MPYQVNPSIGLKSTSISRERRPESASTVQVAGFPKGQAQLKKRLQSGKNYGGGFSVKQSLKVIGAVDSQKFLNEYQTLPGNFTRNNTLFTNALQDNIRAGFPSKNFQRMSHAKVRETMLENYRNNMSAATTSLETSTGKLNRTASKVQSQRQLYRTRARPKSSNQHDMLRTMGISMGERDISNLDDTITRPFSGELEFRKRQSVPSGFTGNKYTGATGHRRLQSAVHIGTRINSVGCFDEDLAGKTSQAIRNKKVSGKLHLILN